MPPKRKTAETEPPVNSNDGTDVKTRRRAPGAAAAPPAAPTDNDGAALSPTHKRRKGGRDRLGGIEGGQTSAAAQALEGAANEAGPQHRPERADAAAQCTDLQMEAVVKVFCVHSEPNFSLPWQRKRQYTSSGSGFVISGRRILTNAHCVDHHTQVKVKRRGTDTKFVASVLSVGTECDIAMLTVEDDAFWEGLQPVQFGELPRLQAGVTVVGYPIGGDTMSVTQGVVSRIEVTSYVHGASELLGIQVDAAINAGNSGGPGFNDRGECVGIAFQSLKNEDIENISFIIPTPVINHFIEDYERHGRYTGFPSLGVEWQKMESPVMRAAMGMAQGQRGVLVRRIEPTSSAAAVIQPDDVILSFEGVEIGVDGTVPFRSGERISFSYLISQRMTGDEATLTVFSQGKEKKVKLALRPLKRLVPVHIDNKPPSYFIVGGLVFSPVTIPLLRAEYGKEFDFEAPVKLLEKMMHAMKENEAQQIVVLSQVLAADANVGYEEVCNTQVLKVNGTPINNLQELVAAVESSDERFFRFDLEYRQVVILDKAEAQAATPSILEQHCIPSDRSVDLTVGDGDGDGGEVDGKKEGEDKGAEDRTEQGKKRGAAKVGGKRR